MLRVAAPGGARYEPALLTGLSLLRYPAFTAHACCERVRERLTRDRPELVAAGIHLIVAQLPDGDLILGDSHDYGDPVSPFHDERLDDLVLAEARRLLGIDRLEIRERWHGVYPVAPGDPFLVEEPMAGVRLVEVVSGVGMTTALGLAVRVLDELLSRDARPAAHHPGPRERVLVMDCDLERVAAVAVERPLERAALGIAGRAGGPRGPARDAELRAARRRRAPAAIAAIV